METKTEFRRFVVDVTVIAACVHAIIGLFTVDDLEAIRKFVLAFLVLWMAKTYGADWKDR